MSSQTPNEQKNSEFDVDKHIEEFIEEGKRKDRENPAPDLDGYVLRIIGYFRRNIAAATTLDIFVVALGTAIVVFNGWDFRSNQPTFSVSGIQQIVGVFLLIFGTVAVYAVNTKHFNMNRVVSGMLISAFAIAVLAGSFWLYGQPPSWNFENNSANAGTIHPLLSALALPLLVIGLISLIVGICYVAISTYKRFSQK